MTIPQKINPLYLEKFIQIGIALSVEKDIGKLLEMIVTEARALSNADAGTLYLLQKDKNLLQFAILQNDSLKTIVCKQKNGDPLMPNVELYKNNAPNYSNVSSYVALSGEIINIQDVYSAEGFDFTGPKTYDDETGYRSKSMLVIPLKNHESETIGVLQLINAQDSTTGEIISFSEEYVELTSSLASQAAVALTNAQLLQELRHLFYAFLQSIATVIDEKSPYTGGHINRVVELAMMIAGTINEQRKGPFRNTHFNHDELEELRLAAWMHDVGKLSIPEHVFNKSTKLQTIFDRLHIIETRFLLIAEKIKNEHLCKKLELKQRGADDPSEVALLEKKIEKKLKILSDELSFIKRCNSPLECLDKKDVKRIKKISKKTFMLNGNETNYLSQEEVEYLSILDGTLTEEEKEIIRNHVKVTLKILKQLTFPKGLSKVPEFAASHHEKLDGSGYPRGLSNEELPIQSRIMAIADIFEALTSVDRPYKSTKKLSEVLNIMNTMKKNHHIDPDIYDLFIDSNICYNYVKKEISPEQIDCVPKLKS